jgi:hypothetical protein
LKPVATIVVQPDWSPKYQKRLTKTAETLKLTHKYVTNERGVQEMYSSNQPDATLKELLDNRSCLTRHRVEELARGNGNIMKLLEKTVNEYIEVGFDCSYLGETRVSFLESALLYGYPLNMALSEMLRCTSLRALADERRGSEK